MSGNSKSSRKKYVSIFLLILVVSIGGFTVLARVWQHSIVGVHVAISGTRITDSVHIMKLLALTDTSRLADLDLLLLRRKILTNPYIRDVVLRRDPPATLQVEISERVAAAVLLDQNNRNWLMDTAGVILPFAVSVPINDVPVLSGAGNTGVLKPGLRVSAESVQRGLSLLRKIQGSDPGFLDLLSEINVGDPQNVILFMLQGGVPVRIGSEDRVEAKLKTLKTFWATAASQYEPALIDYIDLRFRNQVIVRCRERQDAFAGGPDSLQKEIMKPSFD